LPWSLLFIAATFKQIASFKQVDSITKAKVIFLVASFWLTFGLFSATKFQLDHYTNILMPFAAISIAMYLARQANLTKLASLQNYLGSLILVLNGVITWYVLGINAISCLVISGMVILLAIYWLKVKSRLTTFMQILWLPSLSIMLTFILLMGINRWVYAPYDTGYQTARFLNKLAPAPVYDLASNWLPLGFYVQLPYSSIANSAQLPAQGSYYVVAKASQVPLLSAAKFQPIKQICGNTIDRIIPYYRNPQLLKTQLECLEVFVHVD
jgi:glucan phosphoethanolaminetransferase (alkaline phosphatase superfamily)